MIELFIDYWLRTTVKLMNKIKPEFDFKIRSLSSYISKDKSETIFECILYFFLIHIVADEEYITASENKIINYCLRHIEHESYLDSELYKKAFITKVKDYLTEFTEKEILDRKTKKDGSYRYSFNKSYYERIKAEK